MPSRRGFLHATAAAAVGCVAGPLPHGTATAASWREPPLRPGTVVFQGDSITDGWRARNVAEPNVPRALGSGYPLLVAGALMRAQPSDAWRFHNRGVSGDKVPDLRARWDADTIALQPDVVTILVGVNDYWHKRLRGYHGTVAAYEDELAELVTMTRRALPAVRVYVLEPFVLRTGHVDASWFPEFDDRRAAAASAARASGASFIPLQSRFDELVRTTGPAYWAADGVHPTPSGNAVIAEALLERMSDRG